jgi:hypothetical protein
MMCQESGRVAPYGRRDASVAEPGGAASSGCTRSSALDSCVTCRHTQTVRRRLRDPRRAHRRPGRPAAVPGPGQSGGLGAEPPVPPDRQDDQTWPRGPRGVRRGRTRSLRRPHPRRTRGHRRRRPPSTSPRSGAWSSTPSARTISPPSGSSPTASSTNSTTFRLDRIALGVGPALGQGVVSWMASADAEGFGAKLRAARVRSHR